jgi:hypothetical protein
MSGRGCLYRRGRIYWVKLSVNGKPVYMTSHSSRREDAVRLLNSFLGDAARGKPVIPKADQVKFEDAVAVLLRNYRINGRRSLAHVERRIRLHLAPFFGTCRLASITSSDVAEFIDRRLRSGAQPAAINRDLAALKRTFPLCIALKGCLAVDRTS